jgi:hypothetical protein
MGNAIQFQRSTYHGPVDGDFGVFNRVFTHPYVCAEFAGSHCDGVARVGVRTWTNGDTCYVECDTEGNLDGRYVRCYADGDTVYRLWKQGDIIEAAGLNADGTCWYNGVECSEVDMPFVELKAKVEPIKARPTAP